jgi:RHS repeat-associated protein
VIRYAGYVYDAATGLYYVGARYYDPETRQFTSRDPARADGAESAYQYASGNPVLSRDPSGEKPIVGDGYYARYNPKTKSWDAVRHGCKEPWVTRGDAVARREAGGCPSRLGRAAAMAPAPRRT